MTDFFLRVISLYCNPDINYQIFYCLLASMSAMQSEDICDFLICGRFEGHHQKWFRCTTTNHHGVAALDFSTVSGCDQLVARSEQPMHVVEHLT